MGGIAFLPAVALMPQAFTDRRQRSHGSDCAHFGYVSQADERRSNSFRLLLSAVPHELCRASLPLLPLMMAGAKALSVLVAGKERPIASVRFDVGHMRGNHGSPFLCTRSAIRLLDEPVSLNRLPNR